ncbi:MAG: hypothetical protein AAFQ98_23120 [Bacteroidota bacterium]
MMNFSKNSRFLWVLLFMAVALFISGCDGNTNDGPGEDVIGTGDALPGLSSQVPGDVSATASTADLSVFAWQEFVALNWKAQPGARFMPDGASFADMGNNPDTTVWMTYAHRTEYLTTDNNLGPIGITPVYSYKNPPQAGDSVSGNTYMLYNNLDEDNEIGSCYLFKDGTDEVQYQAKVNLVEYNYARTFGTQTAMHDAKKATGTQVRDSANYWVGQANDVASCHQNVPAADTATTLCFPCGTMNGSEGAIEIKTAWRKLSQAEQNDSAFLATIIHSPAIYYTSAANPADDGTHAMETEGTYYQEGMFGLIGMHIIHKTENYPSFVFATFEHVTDRTDDYQYINLSSNASLDTPGGVSLKDVVPFGILSVTDSVTTAYHNFIKASNPNSVLLNYKLTGVQGRPTSDSTSDNYYLANYVIESDYALARFPQSNDINPGSKTFEGQLYNTVEGGMRLNMGGCQGCHGFGAQLNGADFSFVTIPTGSATGQGFNEPDILQSLKQAQAAAQAAHDMGDE